MPPNPDEETLSVQIANQIINVANARLQDGVPPAEIAQGLRHAAANFSSFAASHQQDPDFDPNRLVEEFAQLLEYYLGRHGEANASAGGLMHLIDEVKGEF
ncbi:MAG: DUF3144 domain-containing protein [Rhodospirillales bacterium]